jgi:hypothetical protein
VRVFFFSSSSHTAKRSRASALAKAEGDRVSEAGYGRSVGGGGGAACLFRLAVDGRPYRTNGVVPRSVVVVFAVGRCPQSVVVVVVVAVARCPQEKEG